MSVTAQAAVLKGVEEPFVFEEVTLDELRPDEVLVRIAATGLCHTDLAVQHGHIPGEFPLVLGHEGAGVIEAVGSAVVGVAAGDHVALSFAACGTCRNCIEGRPAYCVKFLLLNIAGVREDGSTTLTSADGGTVRGSFFGQSSFATHAIVSARNLVPIPADVPLEIVGPLGCGVQTGAGTVMNTLAVPAGAAVAISGAGAVGLSGILGAVVAGATTIIAIDVIPERLETAERLGATHTIDGSQEDVSARILEITGGIGVGYALDTTAIPAVIGQLVGGTSFGAGIALVGVPKPDAVLPVSVFSGSGRTFYSAIEGDAVPQTFIPAMIELYRAGRFPFDELITTYPFADIEQAIADTQSGKAVKAVLVMPG